MLASFLPGLREVRTPLAVGYAWIVVLYLAIGHRLPDAAAATGVIADIYRAAGVITLPGLAVAGSVVAYLLGIIITPVTNGITAMSFRWRDIFPWRIRHRIPGKRHGQQVEEAFEAVAVDRLADRLRDDEEFRAALVHHGVETGKMAGVHVDADGLERLMRKDASARRDAVTETMSSSEFLGLTVELPRMVQRMKQQDEQSGAEYDRLTSESEFRAGMAWPLLGLLGTLAARESAWWLVACPAVILLLASASRARRDAQLLLSSVLAARRYDDRAMQIFDGLPAPHLLDRRQSLWWTSDAVRCAPALVVDAGSSRIACGTNDGHVLIFDATTGGLVHSLTPHGSEVTSIAFSRDGSMLATADADRIHVHDAVSAELIATIAPSGVDFMAFTPDQALIAVSYQSVRRWTAGDRTQLRSFPLPHTAHSADLSPGGTLAVACLDESLYTVEGEVPKLVGKVHDLRECRWMDDRTLVATGDLTKDDTSVLMVWEAADDGWQPARVKRRLPAYRPISVAVGADLVAHTDDDDVVVAVGSDPAPRRLGQHEGVIALALSPDASFLVSASRNGYVFTWDVASARRIAQLELSGRPHA